MSTSSAPGAMPDRPAEVEKTGIEHVTDEQRHGSPGRVFTLWFAANLTIADYAVGVLCVLPAPPVGFGFGLTLGQSIPILLAGNVLGGVFLALTTAMGPSLGFPQMLSSRASFGRLGNYIPGGLNWISTVGWFSVNTILAVIALQVVVPGADFVLAAAAYVVIQAVIAIYGHDFIHLFEKVMSIVLGLLFGVIFALSIPNLGSAFSYVPAGSSGNLALGAMGIGLVASFSYLMSWSPYASDYSRYLPSGTSKRRVMVLTLAGGAASSFAVEVVGATVGSLTPVQTANLGFFAGLSSYAGGLGALAMVTLILGAFAADALNLYTNSLSALVLDVRAARWKTVAAGAVAGFAISVAVGAKFELFFEYFLLGLSYWITPWLAIVLVDFYLLRRTTVESASAGRRWDWKVLAIYGVSILASVPFMNLRSLVGFIGPVATLLQGGDFSYFVSFAIAFLLTWGTRGRVAAAIA